jgi:hypothetical protein
VAGEFCALAVLANAVTATLAMAAISAVLFMDASPVVHRLLIGDEASPGGLSWIISKYPGVVEA